MKIEIFIRERNDIQVIGDGDPTTISWTTASGTSGNGTQGPFILQITPDDTNK